MSLDPQPEWLISARQALEAYNQAQIASRAAAFAAENGLGPDEIRTLLELVVRDRCAPPAWSERWAQLGDEVPQLGRWLLAQTALRSLDSVPLLPVTPDVMRLICREYELLVHPTTWKDELFTPGGREYRWFAQQVLLQRFVAGQLHWTISGIPRSWLLKMKPPDVWATISTIWSAGGFAPWFSAHIPDRGGAMFLVESEFRRCSLRMAQSMELQPGIHGLVVSSWFYSDETIAVTPALAWMRRFFLEKGGMLAHMGAASPDAGFLKGSSTRKALYESGAYRPREAAILWPRKEMLAWARSAS